LIGVTGAVEFLKELHLGGKPYVGSRVSVIGGGNAAIDAAQCALRLGAGRVTIIYRRTRAEMPALKHEIASAEREGIQFVYLAAPLRFAGENGQLRRIICQRMVLGDFDAGGRRKPMPSLGDTFEMEVDQVILAIGQEVDDAFDLRMTGMTLGRGRLIEVVHGKKSQTAAAMVFTGGDVVTGPNTVVAAIAAGRRAAEEIDAAIRRRAGEPAYVPPLQEPIDIPRDAEAQIEEKGRSDMPEADIACRIADFAEIELGFTDETAVREAGRCLQCDIETEDLQSTRDNAAADFAPEKSNGEQGTAAC
jgi:NADH-quinone oxidoreductase subunit F